MSRAVTAAAVARKLNQIELDTLRQVVEQQHAEIQTLRTDLYHAENAAESWRDDALRMMEAACADGRSAPGITQDGALVLVGGAA